MFKINRSHPAHFPVCVNGSSRSINALCLVSSRIESELDDLGNLGHLGHFLVGHVGLIRKLNKYLNVTWISHVC